MAAPALSRFEQLYRDGEYSGLVPAAAWGYAVLGWWLEHYGFTAPRISSGARSAEHQNKLRAAWDAWFRGGQRGPAPYGMIARPAAHSAHTLGQAFDVSAPPDVLAIMGAWAPLLGLRWGGNFAAPDPVHFDLGEHL